MGQINSKQKTCSDYKVDLSVLITTGRINDEYIEHLGCCTKCQKEVQTLALKDLRALPLKKNPPLKRSI